jgi:hypothetical protein
MLRLDHFQTIALNSDLSLAYVRVALSPFAVLQSIRWELTNSDNSLSGD